MTRRALATALLVPSVLTTLIVLTVLMVAPASAVDGKWTPTQILEHDPAWLQELGLEIPPDELWGAEGAGLLDAVIKIGGCSAGFVSADGLLVTNHHCVFGILQHHSTPQSDRITDGFIAADRSDEIGGAGTRATVPHQIHDVTARVEGAVPAGADDLARYRAIDAVKKELVAECEQRQARRCQVAAYDGGVRYELVESLEYHDVRLVFSPPRAIGEYGGEIDNWSWPRHNGDFSLARVYAAPDGSPAEPSDDNVPLAPRHFFPIATQGIGPGSFVMVAGYPGQTYRSLTAPEMAERAELYFPQRAELYRSWIDIMETAAADSDAARIALASRIKSLANREKNARGQVAGIARGDLLGKRRQRDHAVLTWAAGRANAAAAAAAYRELEALVERERTSWTRDFLLDQISSGPRSLELALKLVRWAGEKSKPDLEREPAYMERERDRLKQSLERAQRVLHRPAEEALLVDLLQRFAAAGAGDLVDLIDPNDQNDPGDPVGPAGDPEAGAGDRLARVRAVHTATRVTDAAARAEMFEESEQQLRDRHDPLLDLAFRLDPVLRELDERRHRHAGAVSRLRPVWRRAVIAHAGRPVAPDGNSTLRLSLAHVQGYSPQDAVWMKPQTTLAGLVAKHTGTAPFAAPEGVRARAELASASRWADAGLGDLPICFLADGDTTGGSSGSPVLNGRGELVGVNFDRVWENVANDFGFNPEIARNIAVDVRYLLWVLEELYPERAGAILAELGVAAPPGTD